MKTGGNDPDTENTTIGSRSPCLGQEVVGGIPPDAFFVSGWERCRDAPDTKNATVGSRHSCLGRKSCREGVGNIPDTKNATTGLHSSCLGGRGWWEGCRDCNNLRRLKVNRMC